MAERVPIERTCAAPGCRAPRDRPLSGLLVLLLPLTGMGLRVFGFTAVYRAARRWSYRGVERNRHRPPSRSPERIAALVTHINRHVLPYQSRCLLESLTLWFLLRRAGHAAELRLGARTLLGPLEAHAWVELDGVVLNDAANVGDVYPPFELARAFGKSEIR